MASKQMYRILSDSHRQRATQAVLDAPQGWVVTIQEPTRSLDQSAKLHACFNTIAKSGMKWADRQLTADQWKVLLISGYAVATGIGADIVKGIEDEVVNIRESSAAMGVRRMSSLLEYVQAFMADHDIISTYGPDYD